MIRRQVYRVTERFIEAGHFAMRRKSRDSPVAYIQGPDTCRCIGAVHERQGGGYCDAQGYREKNNDGPPFHVFDYREIIR